MKKYIAVLALMLGLAAVSRAGTPQENGMEPNQVGPYSGATIFTSSAATGSNGNISLVVSTPTAINSGGATISGRNCFTRVLIQVSTVAVVTVVDANTTKWTIYGAGLGTTGTNTLSLPEDHLGPLCTAVGDQTVFNVTNTAGASVNPQVVAVEGYTTYGGTNNAGPMQ